MINLLGHIKKLIQIDTSEGKLPEGTLLLKSFVDLQNVNILDHYSEITTETNNSRIDQAARH